MTGQYEIVKKGDPDPQGARYVVLDYVHDLPARRAATTFANSSLGHGGTALFAALSRSLKGEDEDVVLGTYQLDVVREGARYLVLDYVHSYPARVALLTYADALAEDGRAALGEVMRQELRETLLDHAKFMTAESERIFATGKTKKRKKRP